MKIIYLIQDLEAAKVKALEVYHSAKNNPETTLEQRKPLLIAVKQISAAIKNLRKFSL